MVDLDKLKWVGKMNEKGLENDGKWPKKQSLLISAGFFEGFFMKISVERIFLDKEHREASRSHNFSSNLLLEDWRPVLAIISYDKILLMANSGSTWGWQLLGGVKNFRDKSMESRLVPLYFIHLDNLLLLWSCCLKRWSVLHQTE